MNSEEQPLNPINDNQDAPNAKSAEYDDEAEMQKMLDPSNWGKKPKQKNKKKSNKFEDGTKIEPDAVVEDSNQALETTMSETAAEPGESVFEGYSYSFMLNRIIEKLAEHNVNVVVSGSEEKRTATAPQITYRGRKDTIIANIVKVVQNMLNPRQRETNLAERLQHIIKYVKRELSCEGHYENGRLHLVGYFKADKIQNILKKYDATVILCARCQHSNTKLFKCSTLRKYCIKCYNCSTDYCLDASLQEKPKQSAPK